MFVTVKRLETENVIIAPVTKFMCNANMECVRKRIFMTVIPMIAKDQFVCHRPKKPAVIVDMATDEAAGLENQTVR